MKYFSYEKLDGAPLFDVKIRREGDTMNNWDAARFDNSLLSFRDKFSEVLGNVYLSMDLKETGNKIRGQPECECRINLVSNNGNYHATCKGIGVANSVGNTLELLEVQIEKKKHKYSHKVSSRKSDPYTVIGVEEET